MPALLLEGEARTRALGQSLARRLASGPACPALYLYGPMGAGKTTLVRALVAALPGSEAAEVGSPSFNLVNYYPTRPRVAHFDLYRLDERAAMDPGEEFWDCLEDSRGLLVVEWAERLAPLGKNVEPPELLRLRLAPQGPEGRLAVLEPHGPRSEHFTQLIVEDMQPVAEVHISSMRDVP